MNGPIAWSALAAWFAVVVAYGLWRVARGAAPDPIRPPGPLDQV